jgi:hypothetical protein
MLLDRGFLLQRKKRRESQSMPYCAKRWLKELLENIGHARIVFNKKKESQRPSLISVGE